jgi:hypothetical protein
MAMGAVAGRVPSLQHAQIRGFVAMAACKKEDAAA